MKNSKLWMGLLSLLLAFALWVYVVTVISPESQDTFGRIPVTLTGADLLEERKLMITSETEFYATLRLEGNRTDLNQLSRANISLVADLSRITEAGVHELAYNISYPPGVQSSAITVLERSPLTVSVTVEERATKEIPVVLTSAGSVPEGYIADTQNAVLEQTAVTVSGPKAVVDEIDRAVVTVDLKDKTETIVDEFSYVLCDADGKPVEELRMLTASIESVRATIRIQQVKEIALKVNVIAGGGATEATCRVTVKPDKIRVCGSESALEGLEELILGEVKLGELPESTELTFPVVLPEGVTNLTGSPEANVSVRFLDLLTRSFSVADIRRVNIPNGMEVDMITEILSDVRIRGTAAALEQVTEEDLYAIVDFSGAELGASTFAATIYIAGAPGCGAVGTYSVSASLQQKPN